MKEKLIKFSRSEEKINAVMTFLPLTIVFWALVPISFGDKLDTLSEADIIISFILMGIVMCIQISFTELVNMLSESKEEVLRKNNLMYLYLAKVDVDYPINILMLVIVLIRVVGYQITALIDPVALIATYVLSRKISMKINKYFSGKLKV